MLDWKQENNLWFCYKDNQKIKGWTKDENDKWYHLNDKDGSLDTGFFQTATDGDLWFYSYPKKTEKDGNTHYTGECATGWIQVDKTWYYLCPEKTINYGVEYSKCSMITNWYKIDGVWYYFLTEKTEYNGSTHYKGECVCNSTLIINGQKYTFKDNGSLVESATLVTKEQLIQIGWTSARCTDTMLADLNNCLTKFKINTSARIRHFISQIAHESACGYYMVEEASGSAYEGRSDLGNTQIGDGRLFRGGGYLQITGRSNYQAFANYIGDQQIMIAGASYVGANYPFSSGGYWWMKNNMNALCDSGADCKQITLRVNGGYNGLSERQKYYAKCCNVFQK